MEEKMMFKAKRNQSIVMIAAAALGLVVLLDGCQVGPKYHPPTPTAVTAPNYKESTVNFHDQDGWKVASPQDAMIRGKWWEVFNEPELNALEEQLNVDNENIKVSFENFMEARAMIAEARSQYWPTITAGASWNRSRSSANLRNSSQANTGTTSTLWSLPLNVSWTPDLWGKIRNEVHSAEYAAQVSAADLELEKLTEQASLAQFFFEIRGQDMLQQILNQTVEVDQKALDATQGAYDAGVGDYISVVEAQTTLKSAQSSAINVGLLRAQYEHAIAMLVGKVAQRFFDSRQALALHAAGDPDGRAFAACRAPAGRCRGRAHACRGQCDNRHRLRCVLSPGHPLHGRRIREFLVQASV